jgi:hypothetical protein
LPIETLTAENRTVLSTTTKTVTASTITRTATVTRTNQHTITDVVSLSATVTTVVDTLTATEPVVVDVTSIETVFQTAATVTVVQKRDPNRGSPHGQKAAERAATASSTCCAVTVLRNSYPTYASACSSFAKYSSACSCNGVTGSTTTIKPTATSTVTQTVTLSPTTTVTATLTAILSITVDQTSKVPLTATQLTTITDVVTSTEVIEVPTTVTVIPTATVTCTSYGFQARATSGPFSGSFIRYDGSFMVFANSGSTFTVVNSDELALTGDSSMIWSTLFSLGTDPTNENSLVILESASGSYEPVHCTFGGSALGHPIGPMLCTVDGVRQIFASCASDYLYITSPGYGGCTESDLVAIPICL